MNSLHIHSNRTSNIFLATWIHIFHALKYKILQAHVQIRLIYINQKCLPSHSLKTAYISITFYVTEVKTLNYNIMYFLRISVTNI